jgi:hypothetical protein
VQPDWQLHEEQQRRQHVLESQTTLLESLKIFDQAEEADGQCDIEEAIRLYSSGLPGAAQALKLWPASNPMAPMVDQCRSRSAG